MNSIDNNSKAVKIKNALTSDWSFLKEIYGLLLEGNAFDINGKNGVVNFVNPDQLRKNLDLTIPNTTTPNLNELKDLLRNVIKYSVKTNHPYFRNQLFGQMDPYGLAGTWISEALNTSAYTFEVAPVFSLIETEIIQTICRLFEFENGDGIFAPGGSMSNMYSLVLARYDKFPDTKKKGLFGLPPLAMFISEEAHYSLKKAANWIGLGYENCIVVKTNQYGQMIGSDLEEKIILAKETGKLPFYVNATAGTTVLGAFDDLDEISKICKKYQLWLHVDACLGGSVILSKNYKHLLHGISKVNSLAWNPHKSLGAPLQCSLFLVNGKHKPNILSQCNAVDVKYLFQQDKYYDVSYDTGNKSIQCGRKIDAFKLWVMFKTRGLDSFEVLVDHSIDIAKTFYDKIKTRNGFRIVQNNFQYTNVCFWYIPKKIRNMEETENWMKTLGTIAPKIKERMIMSGTLMVGYTPLSSRKLENFIRMTFTCFPVLNENDLDFLINEIEKLGEQCL